MTWVFQHDEPQLDCTPSPSGRSHHIEQWNFGDNMKMEMGSRDSAQSGRVACGSSRDGVKTDLLITIDLISCSHLLSRNWEQYEWSASPIRIVPYPNMVTWVLQNGWFVALIAQWKLVWILFFLIRRTKWKYNFVYQWLWKVDNFALCRS